MHSIDGVPGQDAPAVRGTRTVLACAVALTLAAPLVANAAEGMREVRDPKTGELRGPTAAEAAAFEKADAQLRRSRSKQAAKPAEIQHPDGSVEMKLDEDTMMYSVVRANQDGTLTTACLPAKQAQAFVKSSSRTTSFAATPAAKAGHAKQ